MGLAFHDLAIPSKDADCGTRRHFEGLDEVEVSVCLKALRGARIGMAVVRRSLRCSRAVEVHRRRRRLSSEWLSLPDCRYDQYLKLTISLAVPLSQSLKVQGFAAANRWWELAPPRRDVIGHSNIRLTYGSSQNHHLLSPSCHQFQFCRSLAMIMIA